MLSPRFLRSSKSLSETCLTLPQTVLPFCAAGLALSAAAFLHEPSRSRMQRLIFRFLASMRSLSEICVVPGGQADEVEEGAVEVVDEVGARVRAEVGVG